MKVLRLTAVALFAFALAPAFATYSASGGNCASWAVEIGEPRDSYRMRQLGCFDPNGDAVYVARPGICNQIARQATRAGLRGHDVVVYVRDKNPACYWNPDYRNYAVALTTQGG